jgi:hypothetical protein
MIVSAMLNAGHVALSQFQDNKTVTLKSLKQEVSKDHPTSGLFSPTVTSCSIIQLGC